LPRKKDLESLRELEDEREKLIESIEKTLDERQEKRDKLSESEPDLIPV
jgi:hypothetical protein